MSSATKNDDVAEAVRVVFYRNYPTPLHSFARECRGFRSPCAARSRRSSGAVITSGRATGTGVVRGGIESTVYKTRSTRINDTRAALCRAGVPGHRGKRPAESGGRRARIIFPFYFSSYFFSSGLPPCLARSAKTSFIKRPAASPGFDPPPRQIDWDEAARAQKRRQ